MSERAVMAVVSDLIKTGLTVEQQILVNELALVVADEQRRNDERSIWRERKRMSRECPGTNPHTPIVELNKNLPGRGYRGNQTNPRALGTNPRANTFPENQFLQFWEAYPRRQAKGFARKAYKHALARGAGHEDLVAGARRYAVECAGREKQYIALPASWLNADRWLDEPENKVVSFTSPPKRSWAEIKAERMKAQGNETGG